MTIRCGFIGLGKMGKAIAGNLAPKGFPTVVFDVVEEPIRDLEKGGAKAAAGPSEVGAGADVIGANCGQGIDGYIGIAKRLSSATDLPIWIKANAGIPKVVGGEVIYDTTPEEFAVRGGDLLEAGASFIGGCCGTSPDFIQALRKELAA